MEKSQICESHCHPVLIAGGDDLFVRDATPGLRDELDAELGCMVDGVSEGEEGVTRDAHVAEATDELGLLLIGKRVWDLFEIGFPKRALCRSYVPLDVPHASIHTGLCLGLQLRVKM